MSNLTAPNLGVIVTNDTARRWIYGAFILAGFVLGGIQAWYGIDSTPTWIEMDRALRLYGYVGIAVGGLAIANVPPKATL